MTMTGTTSINVLGVSAEHTLDACPVFRRQRSPALLLLHCTLSRKVLRAIGVILYQFKSGEHTQTSMLTLNELYLHISNIARYEYSLEVRSYY